MNSLPNWLPIILLVIQVTLVAAVGLLASSLLKSAAHRHSVLAAAMLCILASPLFFVATKWTSFSIKMPVLLEALYFEGPQERDRSAGLPLPGTQYAQADVPGQLSAGAPKGLQTSSEATPQNPPESKISQIQEADTAHGAVAFRVDWLIGSLWIVGTLFCLAGVLRAHWNTRLILQSVCPLEAAEHEGVIAEATRPLGLRKFPRIGTTGMVAGPAVAGILRPWILLPARYVETLSNDELLQVLIHEGAHALRRDPLLVLLQRICSALYWWHPLVHLVNRQLHRTREEVCDNFVLRHVEPETYGATLLRLAGLSPGAATLPAAIGMLDARWNLEDRIRGLLDGRRKIITRVRFMTAVTVLGGFAVFSALVAGTRVGAQNSDNASTTLPQVDAGSGEIVFITGDAPQAAHNIDTGDGVTIEFKRLTTARQQARTVAIIRWPARDGQTPLQHGEEIATDNGDNPAKWAAAWRPGTKTVWLAARESEKARPTFVELSFPDSKRIIAKHISVDLKESQFPPAMPVGFRSKFATFSGLAAPSGTAHPTYFEAQRVHAAIPADSEPKPGAVFSTKRSAEWRVKFEDGETGKLVPEVLARLTIIDADGSYRQEILRTWKVGEPFWINFGADGVLRVVLSETQYASVSVEDEKRTGDVVSVNYFGNVPEGISAEVKHSKLEEPLVMKLWRATKKPPNVPDAPVQQKERENLKPAAPAPLTPKPANEGADAKPQLTRPSNDKFSAIAVHSGDEVKFVLIHRGSLFSGLSQWTYGSDPGWGFKGSVGLVDLEKTRTAGKNVAARSIEMTYTSDAPDTLFLDGKVYDLTKETGRIFILREKGDPLRSDRTLSMRDKDDLVKLGELADAALRD